MLTLTPVTLATANAFVNAHHRHHKATAGHKFSIGYAKDGELVGVAIVGRPVSRYLDDGWTLEVNRLCTTGEKNACSILYAAFSPIPISLLGFEETKQIGIGYLKNFAAAALAGVVMVLILYLYPHLVTALAVSGGLGKAEMLGLAQGVETFDSFGVIIKTIAVLITTMMGLVKSGSWAKEILGA